MASVVDLKVTSAGANNSISSLPTPPFAFWVLRGSRFSDFNSSDNLVRSILAKPTYGLVCLPTSDGEGVPTTVANWHWRLTPLTVGDTIAAAFKVSVNNATYRYRWINIQGDPTLRAHFLAPPAWVSAIMNPAQTQVTVTWGSSPSASQYYIYRSASEFGPFDEAYVGASGFQLLSNPSYTPLAVSGNSIPAVTHNSGKPWYSVKATSFVTTGSGSYWNVSLGVANQAHYP